MKATIDPLFDTYRNIITYDHSEYDYPGAISDLKKCDNVVIGARIDGPRSPYEVLIDDQIVQVMPLKIQHPSGGGSMLILEVF
jgi:hypothetical protein